MTKLNQTIEVATVTTSRRRFLVRASGLAIAAATGPLLPAMAKAAAPNKTLRFGMSAFPASVKPFEYAGESSLDVKLQLYRGLLRFSTEGKPVPEIAESWTMEGDRTYVFQLRKKVLFSNGQPLTSADVKSSFEQIAAPKSTAYLSREFAVIDSIDASQPSVVRIKLKLPTPAFPELVARGEAPIVSAQYRDSLLDQPLGAGPYVVETVDRGRGFTFKKNPFYFRPNRPLVERMRYTVFADENLRVAALQSGDVDVIEYVPWQNVESLQKDTRVQVQGDVGPYMYLSFNTTMAPFNDVRVRRAVALGVNRADIVKAAFFGQGRVLDGMPIDPHSQMFDPKFEHLWPYQPAEAKALLASASYSGQTVNLLATSTYGMHKDIAEVVQQNLAAIGMQVKLNLPEWGARISLGNQGRYQLAVNAASMDGLDPDAISTIIGSGGSSFKRSFGFASKSIDDGLARARHESDPNLRRQAYADVWQAVRDEVPISTLAFRKQSFAALASVKGFRIQPGALGLYSSICFEDVVPT